ncbi:MAG: phage virion morphogenesis protein [Proteobacteria bacterium]|nr:phage virion morphogenesis protein [Pseudomonadota bacterium]MBU1648233.1 phage virion morphogenesis protein [Pseudomonadota bacterium]
MCPDISVRIDDKQVQAMLLQLQKRCADMSVPMGQIGAFYERSVLENFKAQAAPDGTPWARLSLTTMMMGLNKKGRIGKKGGLTSKGKGYIQGKRILYEKGDLMESVHHQATRNSVTIGSSGSIPYAAIHQFGGKAGRGLKVNIPARPYLAMNRGTGMELAEKDRKMILEILKGHLSNYE